jgi:hypothetical protein
MNGYGMAHEIRRDGTPPRPCFIDLLFSGAIEFKNFGFQFSVYIRAFF